VPGAGPGMKLLIIDDEQKICELLSKYFSLKGYETRAVSRGEEAVVLAKVYQPDVVLLDLLMPGLGGVETLKQLKQLQPAPKVIMVSAADHQDVAQGAIKLGADAFVCKPPSLPELERLINGYWPSAK